MRMVSGGRYAAITSTLALVVALGGVSYAAVVVTGHQIKDNTVSTRDIKNKTIKTKDISGAAKDALTGDVGPAGPAGPAGPTGPPGPVGPSTKVYSVWNDRPTSLSKSMRTVLTLSVPAGSYVAIAKAVGSNSSGTDFTVACGLIAAGRFFDESSASGSGYSSAVVSNQVAFSTDTTADVTLSCANGSGVLGADSVRNKKLTAIKVGSVTETQGPDVD